MPVIIGHEEITDMFKKKWKQNTSVDLSLVPYRPSAAVQLCLPYVAL